MQQPLRKQSLAICKLYSHLIRPRKLYRHERRTGGAPPFVLLQFGQGKWHVLQIIKTSVTLQIVLAFHRCPRLLSHVAQVTAYQAIRYTAEMSK